jgi:superfamily I DNA/RNA helicase
MENLNQDCMSLVLKFSDINDIQNVAFVSKTLYTNTFEYRNFYATIPSNLKWTDIRYIDRLNVAKRLFEKISYNVLISCKYLCYKSKQNGLAQEIQNAIDFRLHNNKFKYTGLTYEQNEIRNFDFLPKQMYAIQAFAGTGKTTTLVEIAKKNREKKILYLAFNKALAIEASESAFKNLNVEVFTIHSLALQHTSQYNVANLTNTLISNYLQMNYDDAFLTRKVLNNFLASYDRELDEIHIPYNVGNVFLDYAKQLWNAMLEKEFPMCHDGYVKLFMIEKKQLNYDLILIDEAQDITYCMFRCIKNQKNATKIFVGDMHQQIYGFRNVCNVIENVNPDNRFGLHQSFRFGFELTSLVNNFLQTFKKESSTLIPCYKKTTIVNRFNHDENYTIVCRSNYTIRKMALEYANKKIRFTILGKKFNPEKEIHKLDELHNLEIFGESNHRKLNGLSNLNEALLHFTEIGNETWKMRIRLYVELGYDNCRNGLHKTMDYYTQDNPKVILTTVHQSKGLEFDCVKIADDFQYINPQHIVRTQNMMENYNLIYVAMTRAKYKLWLNKSLTNYFSVVYEVDKCPKIIESMYRRCDSCDEYNNVFLIDNIEEFKGNYNPCYRCKDCLPKLAFLIDI